MTKKDEAAQAEFPCDDQGCERANFSLGWTQALDESMKMARKKAIEVDFDSMKGNFIELSDLENILEDLK